MLLTQSTTPIIGQIAWLLGYIMQGIFVVLSAVGIQNIGLCIMVFTFLVRLCMLPMTISQQKSSKMTQAMQPEINKIQKKYRNKKDQASMAKQQEEIQAVYDKYGFSPTGGCLQLIVQMPIFFALYQVIRKIPAYIPQVKAYYSEIYAAIKGTSGYLTQINKIADDLNLSAGYVSELTKGATENQVIDVLSYFRQESWEALAKAIPNAADVINAAGAKIVSMNDFMLGINVSQTPGWHPSVYWLIPLLAGLFQYLSFRTMQQPNQDSQTQTMNRSMGLMMPLMSMYFCIIMPAGLGIYWISSALFQWVQQLLINRYLKNADLDEMIKKNQEKAAKKKAKGKKSLTQRLTSMQSGQAEETKQGNAVNRTHNNTITSIASINTKKIKAKDDKDRDAQGNLKNIDYDSMGEISKKAYLVSHYDEENKTRGGKK